MKRRTVLASMGLSALNGASVANDWETILTISGRIQKFTNRAASTFAFTRKAFLALPQSTIVTATSWTPVSTFVGPTVLEVMREAGVSEGTLLFQTLDDQFVPIPWSDIVRYGVILAHTQNGKPLSKKRWGPLWAIYPRDKYLEELRGPVADSRFIWQIIQIRVEI